MVSRFRDATDHDKLLGSINPSPTTSTESYSSAWHPTRIKSASTVLAECRHGILGQRSCRIEWSERRDWIVAGHLLMNSATLVSKGSAGIFVAAHSRPVMLIIYTSTSSRTCQSKGHISGTIKPTSSVSRFKFVEKVIVQLVLLCVTTQNDQCCFEKSTFAIR